MNGFVGVTDNDWFAFLSQQPGIDEVNFWQRGIVPGTYRRKLQILGVKSFFDNC